MGEDFEIKLTPEITDRIIGIFINLFTLDSKHFETVDFSEFITVNIPVFSGEYIASTCLYMGKDDEGRYILKDESCFKLSKDFLIKNKISVDKEFDGDKAFDIYKDIKKEQENREKQKHKKNRDAR